MGTTTPNLELWKPNGQDPVDVKKDLADNFDKIDAHAHSGTYVPSEVVDAATFGGGVVDATAHIQSKIDAVEAAGGGVVWFPQGTYNFTALTIDEPYVTLAGPGTLYNGTITIGLATGDYIDYHTVLDGLRFDRESASGSVNAIELQRLSFVTVRNCRFNNYNAAVYAKPLALGGSTERHTNKVSVTGNQATNVNYLVHVAANVTGGAMAAADYNVSDNVVRCFIRHIHAEGLDGLVFDANTCFFPGSVEENETKLQNVFVDVGQQIVITGNQLFEAGSEGIYLNQCQYITILGNNIPFPGQRVYADGIRLLGGGPGGSEFCLATVSANHILFPTRRGVSIEDTCGHVSVTGNTIRDPGNETRFYGTSGANTPYGVRADATTTEVFAAGNTSTGSNSGISLAGTFSARLDKPSGASFVGIDGQIQAGSVFATGSVSGDQFRYQGDTTRRILWGTGSPEGAVSASVGAAYLRTDGAEGTTLYIKESGSSTAGWAALDPSRRVLSARGYVAGAYYTAPGAATSTRLFSNNDERLIPFRVRSAQAFDRIAVEVSTAGGSGSLFRLGIKNHNTSTGRPGTVVVDAGTVAGDSLGLKEATISQTLQPGWYWLSAVAQAASGSPTLRGFSGGLDPLDTASSGTSAGLSNNLLVTGVSGALGDSSAATFALSSTAPVIMLRAA